MSFQIIVNGGGVFPKRATCESAGYDLSSNHEIVIKPNQVEVIEIPIQIRYFEQIKAKLFIRSSMGIKRGLRLVDENGEVINNQLVNPDAAKVVIRLKNAGESDVVLEKTKHFAQIVFSKESVEDLLLQDAQNAVNEKGIKSAVVTILNSEGGYSTFLTKAVTLKPKEVVVFGTEKKALVRKGAWCEISPGGGLPEGVGFPNGVAVIDGDYCNNSQNDGHCFLALENTNYEDITLPVGTLVAIWRAENYLIASNEECPIRVRTGGLGHSG